MDFVTCGQMKILERRADAAGLSYYTMMENAGTRAAEIIVKKYKSPIGDAKAFLFCGKGNNGGDGFVVARKLYEQGAQITVILVDGYPVTDDAVTNLRLLEKEAIQIIDMTKSPTPFMEISGRPDIIVDAIYGTGFHGLLNPSSLKSAAFINQFYAKILIVSLDIPSGLGGDVLLAANVDPNAVRTQYTITFHAKKPVHLQAFAKKYCGKIIVVDIGIKENELW